MKFYDISEAREVLEAIVVNYDKRAISKELSSVATSTLKNDGAINLFNFNITLIKQNGKYAIKINDE